MAFKRSIGKMTMLIASISGMVGSGWLLGPFHAAAIAGPAAILSWPLAGILMIFIAYNFIVLTKTLPIAGGTVRFLQLSHGHFVGFTFSWIAWLAWIAVTPTEVLATLQYTATYLPSLMEKKHGASVLTLAGFELAVVLMVIMYFINIAGIKILSRANNVAVLFKLGIPIATFFILLSYRFDAHNFNAAQGFMPMGIKGILAALPTAGVIYSFIGFNPAIQLAAEVKDPKKTIGFAIIGAILTCIVLYTLLQIVFIGALHPSDYANGWSHLSFSGDTGPFAGMILAFGLGWFVTLLYIDAVISPFGTAMVQAAATGRLTYGMAQNGYLPRFLLQLNPKQAPALALTFNILIGLLFFLPFPSWQKMVEFLVGALIIGYVVGPMSLATLKIALPESLEKYSNAKIQTSCLIGFYICNIIIYWGGWTTIYKILIVFAAGYLLLIIYRLLPTKNKKVTMHFNYGWWTIPYIAGMGLLSYLGSFGNGKNIIPFGWDFLSLAAFTIIIFYLAQFLASRPKAIAETREKLEKILTDHT